MRLLDEIQIGGSVGELISWGTHGNLQRAEEDYQTLMITRFVKVQEHVEGSAEYRDARRELARPYWRRAYIYQLNEKFDLALADYREAGISLRTSCETTVTTAGRWDSLTTTWRH